MRSRPSEPRTRSEARARLALELFLGTGAACQDAAAMTRANIRGPRLSYRRGKTGREVALPILPELGKELAHLPRDQMMLLAHGTQGKGYTAGSLSNVFRDMCAEAGLNHCSAHGLRKAGARRLAEHGATEWGGHGLPRAPHREGGEPLHGGCKPGQTHNLGHGEAGGGSRTNIVQPFRKVGQKGVLSS